MNTDGKRAEQLTEAERAEGHYQRRDDEGEWGEPEPVVKPARLEATLSVRFTREELDAVREAAERAGMKPTTFIREAAVAAVARQPLDRARLERSISKALALMHDAQRTLAS